MRWPVNKFSALALLAVIGFIAPAHAQWRYSAYVQTSAGNYIYASTARNYYLTQGLQYRHERWSLDANISLAARDGDNLVVRGEDMMSSNESGHVAMNLGLGDVFVRANYALAWQRNGWPNVTFRVLTKIPTASASRGLGTGEWDAGVFLSLARFANNFYLSTEVGYLWLGDSPGAIYQNPVSYAVGVGRTFVNSRLGLLLLYSGTSKIFADYEAPRQIGIGLNWRPSNRLGFFTNLAGGLSETVPDFSFSFGLSTAL
jgi:hypothetical protein